MTHKDLERLACIRALSFAHDDPHDTEHAKVIATLYRLILDRGGGSRSYSPYFGSFTVYSKSAADWGAYHRYLLDTEGR